LFENTDSFLNKTLILSETPFNSAWAWWTKKLQSNCTIVFEMQVTMKPK